MTFGCGDANGSNWSTTPRSHSNCLAASLIGLGVVGVFVQDDVDVDDDDNDDVVSLRGCLTIRLATMSRRKRVVGS